MVINGSCSVVDDGPNYSDKNKFPWIEGKAEELKKGLYCCEGRLVWKHACEISKFSVDNIKSRVPI